MNDTEDVAGEKFLPEVDIETGRPWSLGRYWTDLLTMVSNAVQSRDLSLLCSGMGLSTMIIKDGLSARAHGCQIRPLPEL